MHQRQAETKNYSFFSNTACEYYPCHENGNPDDFNCLFCYCPLYALGRDCHGDFVYTDKGIKDCSGCLIPHGSHGYDHVTSKLSQLKELARVESPEPL